MQDMLPPLAPPERIQGDMRNRPFKESRDRKLWVLQAVEDKHSNRAIAQALGVSRHAIDQLVSAAGIQRPRGRPRKEHMT